MVNGDSNRRMMITVLVVSVVVIVVGLALYLNLRPASVVEEDLGPCSKRDLADLAKLKEQLPLELPIWMNMWQQLDPDIRIEEFKCLDVEELQAVPAGPAASGADDDPMLVRSPDGQRELDLYSYHWDAEQKDDGPVVTALEPDTSVVLTDLRRNEKARILFLGPDAGVDDALWMDNDTIVIVGYQDALDEGGAGGNGAEPLLWMVRIKEKQVSIFGGRAAAGYDPKEYVTRKLALLSGEQ